MERRTHKIRRTAAVLVTAGVAAGVLGAGFTGSAGAGLPRRVPTATAPPPPPGSGVVIVIDTPEPIGPRSLT